MTTPVSSNVPILAQAQSELAEPVTIENITFLISLILSELERKKERMYHTNLQKWLNAYEKSSELAAQTHVKTAVKVLSVVMIGISCASIFTSAGGSQAFYRRFLNHAYTPDNAVAANVQQLLHDKESWLKTIDNATNIANGTKGLFSNSYDAERAQEETHAGVARMFMDRCKDDEGHARSKQQQYEEMLRQAQQQRQSLVQQILR